VIGHQRVVAFNSDSPHLPASILENAFEALAGHDVVVGPTVDRPSSFPWALPALRISLPFASSSRLQNFRAGSS
jgi:glycosyltransferase A (GT-A) superfamily protein (DUF2064 family)